MMDYTERDQDRKLRWGYPPLKEVEPGVFEIAPGGKAFRAPGHGFMCACEECCQASEPIPAAPQQAEVLTKILAVLERIEKLLRGQQGMPRPPTQPPMSPPPRPKEGPSPSDALP